MALSIHFVSTRNLMSFGSLTSGRDESFKVIKVETSDA
jgi:hypothetical protein